MIPQIEDEDWKVVYVSPASGTASFGYDLGSLSQQAQAANPADEIYAETCIRTSEFMRQQRAGDLAEASAHMARLIAMNWAVPDTNPYLEKVQRAFNESAASIQDQMRATDADMPAINAKARVGAVVEAPKPSTSKPAISGLGTTWGGDHRLGNFK